MIILFKKIIFMFFFVLISLIILYVSLRIVPPDNSRYLKANLNKQFLLQRTQSPKIILVGGSNLAFGVDSEEIEKSLKKPVVNMGLHASLGLRFMLEEIKPYLKNGDIVVIVPEYEHFYETSLDGEGEILMDLFYSNPSVIGLFTSLRQYKNLISAFPYWSVKFQLMNLTGGEPKGIYSRYSFNQKGDISLKLDQTATKFINGSKFPEKPRWDTIRFLNQFENYAQIKGVTLLYSFPPFSSNGYKLNEKQIMFLYQEMKKTLKLKMINQPQDYVFPNDFFYDSDYHINSSGKKIRTKKLINNILENIKE